MGELNSPPRQERLDPIFVPPGRVGGAASLILDGAIEIAHPLKIARLSTPLEAQQARRGGVRVLEIGVADLSALKIRTGEFGAIEFGTLEARPPQGSKFEAHARQIGIDKTCA